MEKLIVAPSILSGNFADMGNEVKNITECGADWIHVDVMDGIFVPNITFGFKMIQDVRSCSNLLFDVHLMIDNPIRYVERFVKAGADLVSFHLEAEKNIRGTIEIIKNSGAKVGLAINPDTPVEKIEPYVDDLDLVLVMSVFPGFGGQKFIEGSLDRITEARKILLSHNGSALIEVDGGVNIDNALDIKNAGANVVVAGNAVFGASDRKQAISRIRGE